MALKEVRLWARLTGGLGGSQREGNLEDRGGDWEDVEEEWLGDSDSSIEGGDARPRRRKKIIKRGRRARAAAKAREGGRLEGTSMPAKKDPKEPTARRTSVGTAAPGARRTSIGRSGDTKAVITPGQGLKKRKNSTDADQAKRPRAMEDQAGSSEGQPAGAESQPNTAVMLMQMKALMEGLTTQMVEVRTDIGDVKKDLSTDIGDVKKDLSEKSKER